MRGRAYARHHKERKKKRVRFYNVCLRDYHERRPSEDPQVIGMMARTPKPCSHPWCCGNPRRFTGERTVQERRRASGDDDA